MIPLVELIAFAWADKHNVSPFLLELYSLLDESIFLNLLKKYAGDTVVLPLPSEFRKLLLAYDIYVRYHTALKLVPKDANLLLYTKNLVQTIADDTGFTAEEIIDIITEVRNYIEKLGAVKEHGQ